MSSNTLDNDSRIVSVRIPCVFAMSTARRYRATRSASSSAKSASVSSNTWVFAVPHPQTGENVEQVEQVRRSQNGVLSQLRH